MYQHILVPLDGSATAERGLHEAVRLAAEQKGRLRLLHVVEDFPMLGEMQVMSSLDASLQKMRAFGEEVLAKGRQVAAEAGVQAEVVLNEAIQGRIADVVVDEARRSGCDLVVMGTHGRRGLNRLALGSDAEAVARNSPVPVLLVRNDPTVVE